MVKENKHSLSKLSNFIFIIKKTNDVGSGINQKERAKKVEYMIKLKEGLLVHSSTSTTHDHPLYNLDCH